MIPSRFPKISGQIYLIGYGVVADFPFYLINSNKDRVIINTIKYIPITIIDLL